MNHSPIEIGPIQALFIQIPGIDRRGCDVAVVVVEFSVMHFWTTVGHLFVVGISQRQNSSESILADSLITGNQDKI